MFKQNLLIKLSKKRNKKLTKNKKITINLYQNFFGSWKKIVKEYYSQLFD